MQVKKDTNVLSSGEPTAVQLEAINAQAKGTLTRDQVYVFSLRLCDDQVDRDHERFDTAALPELAKLFIGKTIGTSEFPEDLRHGSLKLFDLSIKSQLLSIRLLAEITQTGVES